MSQYIVKGTVRQAPAGATIRAFDRDLRTEQPLGQAALDARGTYVIEYQTEQFQRAEHRTADLIVKITDAAGAVLAASPIRFNAGPEEVIDLVVGPDRSPPNEYHALVAELQPLIGSVPITELLAQDVSFLAGDTGRDPQQITDLVTAHRIAAETGLAAQGCYALFRGGLPRELASLVTVGTRIHRKVLDAAIVRAVIASTFRDEEEVFLRDLAAQTAAQPTALLEPATLYAPVSALPAVTADRLDAELRQAALEAVGTVSRELGVALQAAALGLDHRALAALPLATVVDQLLTPLAAEPRLATEIRVARRRMADRPSPTVETLLDLGVPLREHRLFRDDLRRARIAQYAERAGVGAAGLRTLLERADGLEAAPRAAFVALAAEGVVTPAQATDLHLSFELGRLTADNAPLVTALRSQAATSVAELARLSVGDWRQLITTSHATPPPGQTVDSYAAVLAANVELTFPSPTLVWRALPSTGALQPHLETILRANPELDLAAIDWFAADGDGLAWDGVPEADRAAVRKQLMTYQRVLSIADDVPAAMALMSQGYHSAWSVARQTKTEFVAASGLSAASAELIHARAKTQATQSSLDYAAVYDLAKGGLSLTTVGNIYPKLVNDLLQIDGFAELFGPQNYCDCEHCRSILSPAAYFVDLMYFIEQHISKPAFIATNKTGHPLYLKKRRADLWTLPLTCENTNTLVPYLTIVNEILEAHLDALVGGDIYATLANPVEKRSTGLPFTLPFERLRLYLSHFGLTLHDIYALLDQPEAKIWRARLGLSAAEVEVITAADPAGVVQRFGAPASLAAFPMHDRLDRRGFLNYAQLTRDQLDDLLALRFHPDLGAITVGHVTVPDELQNFPETLQNLTPARLDFIHRFVRLWRKTGWRIAELDLVLLELSAAGLIGLGLGADTVTVLAKLVEVQVRLKLSIEEACAVVARLPVSAAYPAPPAERSDARLFERMLDLAQFFGVANAATGVVNQSVPYHHYSQNTTDPDDSASDPNTPALLGALSISETDLTLLFGLLGGVLGFDAAGNTTLDRGRISVLYRHARLARALKLGIDDFLQALRLCFAPADQIVTSLDQIATLIDFRAWLKASPFTVGEIRFILRGEETATVKYASTIDTSAGLVLDAQAAGGPELVAMLRDSLARANRISATQLADTLAWTGIDLASPAIATALAATFTDGEPDDPAALAGVLELARALERPLSLFKNLKFDAEAVAFLTANAAALGIADCAALTLADLRALVTYRALAKLDEDSAPLVQALLVDYAATGAFSTADRVQLADLWQVDRSLMDSLLGSIALPPIALAALVRLAEVLACATTLGVNGFSLSTLVEDTDFAKLTAAAEVALGAFSSKYADEHDRAEKLEPYEDRINTLARDAMCDYMIARQATLKFRGRADIYAHFLLDVDMCGCFRTSRLVCAHGSLQLYVQRCLLNLERSDPDLNPTLSDAAVDPSLIPSEEWAWRKNYRVWEANRKVFLYPENYMEPDLRDDKTPIFLELEAELLAKQITKQSAEDAYRTYVKQFAALARLKFAGAYRDSATSTYHLFARTQQDPPQYYYRSWNQSTWSPWQKVELGINAPYVSAAMLHGRLYVFWAEGRWKEKNSVSGGSSSLDYYEVFVDLGYSFLDETSKWAPVQKLAWLYPPSTETKSVYNHINNEADRNAMEYSKIYHKVYPRKVGNKIVLRYYNPAFQFYHDRQLDLFNNRLTDGGGIAALPEAKAVILDADVNGTARLGFNTYDYNTDTYFDKHVEGGFNASTTLSAPFGYHRPADQDPTRQDIVHLVHSGYPRVVLTLGDQQYLIRRSPTGFGSNGFYLTTSEWEMVRLSTSLADDLGQILFDDGLEAFLSLETQRHTEKPLGITLTSPYSLCGPAGNPTHLDFRGAYGIYFRELFFHVPFRIASHLNANQMFEEAKWWYERIFDPTASEALEGDKPNERYWRFIELRYVQVPKLKAMLSDDAAIEAYRTEPFNPFAIARLRMSAFQKTIVMKYIDNLLDWGDSLFAQDTMESITEATMLYVLASQILGKRPAKLGPCKTAGDASLTYAVLGPEIGEDSEFLITIENWHYSFAMAVAANSAMSVAPIYVTMDSAQVPTYQLAKAEAAATWHKKINKAEAASIGPAVMTQTSTMAFCIPPNADLLAYWDRVEDRLFKIHNCMNLSGVRRSLSLFAPVIDPMALVRAVAAGLSLDAALAALAAPVPPYRFSHLIDKAKEYVATVQSFGTALLGALEKKDTEELTQLRSVHERNLLRMTKDIKTKAVQDAQFAYQAVVEQQTNTQARINHYAGLREAGLTGWEIMQQTLQHTVTTYRSVIAALHMYAGIVYLIPQLGSPFAMKFGGKEMGDSQSSLSRMTEAMAESASALAASASIEASFQRRDQDWELQLATAEQELVQLEQQRLSADMKVQIAVQDLAIHEKTMEQSDELDAFYRTKLTNLGLYEYLSTTLNRLYRQAYNTAYDLAKMAERSYQFERDTSEVLIAGDNWQFDRAGLLAGERLSLQLHQLERAYLQQNTRELEVTQSFSVGQLDPNALTSLRESGSCSFALPEVLFDLTYPGQYRRIVKSVRVTMPCVAGPYVNIGATLTLLSSKLRRTAKLAADGGELDDVPNQKSTSIAVSHAQNDGGLFELSFRDERYLPFEGAGAVESSWRLELPELIRTFDYDTISDVVVHVSYTARYDGSFKAKVETNLADALSNLAMSTGMFRLVSLRHDFPNTFYKLLDPTQPTQTAGFDVTAGHFPYFLRGRDLLISELTVLLKPTGEDPVDTAGLVLDLDGTNVAGGWSTPAKTTLRAGVVPVAGNPVRSWTITAGGVGLDRSVVDDVMILIKYGI